MKLFKTTVLALLLTLPMIGMATDSAQPYSLSEEVMLETGIQGHLSNDDEGPVHVEYLLDSEGRPYIISIWSSDEQITRMIRKMIGQETIISTESDDPSLAITFYYNNIR